MHALNTTANRRRSLRIAAAALIAAAGLSVTACSGSGSASADAAGAGHAKVASARTAPTKAAPEKAAPEKAAPTKAAPEKPAAAPQAAGGGSRTAASRTVPLADGISKAVVRKVNGAYQADIVAHGDVLATIRVTNGLETGLDANDMFVVLDSHGKVNSWMGGGQQGPGTFKTAGGWTVKVTQVGDTHYKADIIANGAVEGTLDANSHDVAVNANGIDIVLTAGGIVSSHQA